VVKQNQANQNAIKHFFIKSGTQSNRKQSIRISSNSIFQIQNLINQRPESDQTITKMGIKSGVILRERERERARKREREKERELEKERERETEKERESKRERERERERE
jgi:hypothetical protein